LPAQPLKLHLGCGQNYLQGYQNIDFPLSEHTVQTDSVADLHANLLDLSYPSEVIDEVRLHHVFEHFPRYAACALVASWQSWLRVGGRLRIEVPDLVLTGLAAINPFLSRKHRGVAERHLFGSHEADWAAHREAYGVKQLRALVRAYGFSVEQIKRSRWRGTFNFDLSAVKQRTLSKAVCETSTQAYLEQFLLDDSPGELRLLDTWMSLYSRQIERTWARAA
jgi:predicted SAM-dependent methyltransferase